LEIGRLYYSAQGRLNRQPYWLATISLCILSILIEYSAEALHDATIVALYLILIMPAYYMVSIKRCHDRNKSGWWILLSFVPILGPLWILIELGCFKGTDGDNEYGADPLAEAPTSGEGPLNSG
jgi:uncharacterized membrane protein YhaH (DUF805 family)